MAETTFFKPIILKKESTKGVAVTPDVSVPTYSISLGTKLNLHSDEPAFGRRLKRYQSLQGMREHVGTMKIVGEPNTIARVLDMLATRTATSGSNPYTHTYGESITTDPNSYTIDVPKGAYVERFYGVEASKISIGFNDSKMELDVDISALGSFYPREIASQSGSGPYTLSLKTDYDPNPTTGLVVGDAIKFYDVSANTYISATIATIPNGTQFTTVTNPTGIAAGDMVMLNTSTPALSVLTPYLWQKTQFFFSDTAANAFTASSTVANQTRLEPGTEIVLMNDFETNSGSQRSGSADPASLIREGGYDINFKPKVFLDTPEKVREWASTTKRALVMRAYSGSTNQYELRVTINNMKALTNDDPAEAGKVLYHEFDYAVDYDGSDGQAFDIKDINAIATI